MFLTPDDIADLTGRKQPKRQIAWLAQNAWKFAVGADGLPKVARSYAEERMGGKPEQKRRPRFDRLSV